MGNSACSCRSLGGNLYQAITERDVDTVQQLLESNPQLVFWRKLGDGLSPLHIAAGLGELQILEHLVRTAQRLVAHESAKKATNTLHSLLDRRNIHGQTALMVACKARNAPCAKLLLNLGADPFLFDNLHAKTCLHYAVLSGSSDCVETLLEDSNIVRTHDGEFKRLRDVSIMDSQGYHRFVDVRSLYAFAPLHLATGLDNLEVARALLNHGAMVSVRCTGVMSFPPYYPHVNWKPLATPLHIAVANSSFPMVKLLLEAMANDLLVSGCPDARAMADSSGMRPLDIAHHMHNTLMAQLVDPHVPLQVTLQRMQQLADNNTPRRTGPASLALLAAAVHRRQLHHTAKNLIKKVDEAAEEEGTTAGGNGRAGGHHRRCTSTGQSNDGGKPSLRSALERSSSAAELALSRPLSSCGRRKLPPPSATPERLVQSDHGGTLYIDHVRSRQRKLPGRVGGALCGRIEAVGPRRDSRAVVPDMDECGICLDRKVEVQAVGCQHCMCLQCALQLTDPGAKGQPTCPFCRTVLRTFELVGGVS